ncbi:hypothetical protein GCM10023093_17720 [Nemorincola caseinilytica]|uniref:Uncharacterized protein n=1 Tax=Nemorincola caseinilytica TaxID=2054315 RepID=A0ABP8NGJ2_9BACT
MTKHNFELQKDTRSVSSLKNHQLVEAMGYLKPDDLYVSEFEYLGVYKMPIVTDDSYVLTLPDYVQAAREAGVGDLDVLVITKATVNDLLRLINFESRPWYRASKAILYKSIKVLEKHLWNTEEGKLWRQTIPGDNINEQIGYLVGYGQSTVSLVKTIGNADYSLLDRIDDPEGDMTLAKALRLIKDNTEQNGKNDNLGSVNVTNLPDGSDEDEQPDEDDDEGDEDLDEPMEDPQEKTGESTEGAAVASKGKSKKNAKAVKVKAKCDVTLTAFTMGLGRYGDFTLDLKTSRPALLYNDALLGYVSISGKDTNDPSEGLHYVIQGVDASWSFHVIATRITNIVKEEEVCGKQA